MIASLTGTLERSSPGQVVINVSGVGYLVNVPMSTFMKLPPAGETARVNTVTVVREDEISLYGFATEGEERIFRLMQDVSGVGPKLALKVLSGIEPRRFCDAVSTGDTALLSSVSGVGKKLAQRLIVELRDKVGAVEGMGEPVHAAPPGGTVEAEAVEALTTLGYPQKVARRAVEVSLREGRDVGETVREALKFLAVKR